MSLDKIFNAESVAIIGASRNLTKRGYQAIKILLEEEFEGAIYPVNPKEKRILGLRCYPDVDSIPDSVDVALVTTPAATVPDILEACGRKGIAGVVAIAGGFGETGAKGIELETRLLETARNNNVRLVGPNTSGMMNLKSNLNLVGLKDAPRGDIALISQSGNMALSLITEAKIKSQRGFSYYVGVGNEVDIKFHEYLRFFKNDPETAAILMYVEGMRQGREFLQEAYKTTRQKPVILLKSGRSATGRKAAGSHTGAMAGISEVASTTFARAGICVVDNADELFSVAETLSCLPPIKNDRIAILADGGGHATIAADLLTDLGLTIPELTEHTQNNLRKILPPAATVRNPVDVAGGTDAEPTLFADCARIILNDPHVGGLLLVGLFGGYGIRFAESLALQEEDAAHQMGKLVVSRKKPIVVHSLYSYEKPHSLHLLRYYNIPVYDSIDVACRCIGALGEYGRYLGAYRAKTNFILNPEHKRKSAGVKIITGALEDGRDSLLETEGLELLALHGAMALFKDKSGRPVVKPHQSFVEKTGNNGNGYLATSEEEAAGFFRKIGKPVAMKVVSPDIIHKSDVKGVRLDIRTEEDVRGAFAAIMRNSKNYVPDADIRGILVSPMAEPGLEVIIGTKTDEQFGPIIMYGLGGIMVEILHDVAFRVVPISRRSAKKMIEETKSFPILRGVRGQAPRDRKAIENLLLICSEVMEAYPEIREMDLNPVIVHGQGLSIVDVRILLHASR
ncbi:acetate--CoA ligase family protein [Desulforhopalus singaporensis]|uniref:Acetyltransferase n=1 Tax=Desulforhopalus singaporensis TaxID=91360 RepID=A0A1H0TFB8_9BACT|nr:acetate--CoA ligase [Desulforhopalus singaporensis]SDP52521.1 acetyltransferase [Desulforhopalus singaporensis]